MSKTRVTTISIIMFLLSLGILIYIQLLSFSETVKAQSSLQWEYVLACYDGWSGGLALDSETNELLFSDLELREFNSGFSNYGEISLVDFLNRFGDAGWEMVTFENIDDDDSCNQLVTFKRAK